MSREQEILDLSRRIRQTPLERYGMEESGASGMVSMLPLINDAEAIFKMWQKHNEKDDEIQSDMKTNILWLEFERQGYSSKKDIPRGVDEIMRSIGRVINSKFVRYRIGDLSKAYNQGNCMEFDGKDKGLTHTDIWCIIQNIYNKIQSLVSDIAKELDIKEHDIITDGIFDGVDIGYDATELTQGEEEFTIEDDTTSTEDY
jgi:hypothetical protein